MSKAMNKVLVAAVCIAMAAPMVAQAEDHDHVSRPPSYHQGNWHPTAPGSYHGGPYYDHDGGAYRYYNYGGYRPYYPAGPGHYYGGYQPYYYGYNHHHSNDDALWAIGGLVVGAIIGGAVEHANQHPAAMTTAPLPPPPQSQRNCDHVAYDSAGNPYVERSCDR